MRMQYERRDMPPASAIAAYWNLRIKEFGIYDDCQDELPERCCWACGRMG